MKTIVKTVVILICFATFPALGMFRTVGKGLRRSITAINLEPSRARLMGKTLRTAQFVTSANTRNIQRIAEQQKEVIGALDSYQRETPAIIDNTARLTELIDQCESINVELKKVLALQEALKNTKKIDPPTADLAAILSINRSRYAVKKADLEMAKKAIAAGADVNHVEDSFSLLAATVYRHSFFPHLGPSDFRTTGYSLVKLLLNDPRTDIEWTNHFGFTALKLAVESENKTYINLLLQHGANPYAKHKNKTVGEFDAFYFADVNNPELKQLLKDGREAFKRKQRWLSYL